MKKLLHKEMCMKSRIIPIICVLIISMVLQIFTFKNAGAESLSNDRSKRTFYVSDSGNDQNNGNSPNQAWRSLIKINQTNFESGDSILFNCGDKWEGQLFPKGYGVESSPVVISSFGEGEKPHIAANGVSGLLGGALVLNNQDNWVIENLQFSNASPNHEPAERFGVLIRWHDYGTGRNVRLTNCDIHDVEGIKKGRFKGEGIFVIADGYLKPTNYDGVVIENCSIRNISRTGISIWSKWNKRGGLDYGPTGSSGPYLASRNVLIKGNYLENIGGDGILVSCTNGAIIEYNRVYKANINKIDPNAGIWPHNSDSAVVQYNEVSHTFFSGDGQGFDIDILSSHCVVQYNYSHDNEGGFILICGDKASRTDSNIIRYNISQNDGGSVFTFAYRSYNTKIYNNTIFIGAGSMTKIVGNWEWSGSHAYFYNNIFYNKGTGGYDFGKGTDILFEIGRASCRERV